MNITHEVNILLVKAVTPVTTICTQTIIYAYMHTHCSYVHAEVIYLITIYYEKILVNADKTSKEQNITINLTLHIRTMHEV